MYTMNKREKKKDYWTYPHEKRFLNMQPIYKYPYGKVIGIPEGKYNPFLLEGFYQKKNKDFLYTT